MWYIEPVKRRGPRSEHRTCQATEGGSALPPPPPSNAAVSQEGRAVGVTKMQEGEGLAK